MKCVLIPALCLLTTPALALCPVMPDRSDERAELIDTMRNSDTIAKGQAAVDAMWAYYRKAPNATAQEMLNGGMGAIRVGDLITAVDVLSSYLRAMICSCFWRPESH